jgi:hypothetical protein
MAPSRFYLAGPLCNTSLPPYLDYLDSNRAILGHIITLKTAYPVLVPASETVIQLRPSVVFFHPQGAACFFAKHSSSCFCVL